MDRNCYEEEVFAGQDELTFDTDTESKEVAGGQGEIICLARVKQQNTLLPWSAKIGGESITTTTDEQS